MFSYHGASTYLYSYLSQSWSINRKWKTELSSLKSSSSVYFQKKLETDYGNFLFLLCNFDSFCLVGHPYHTAGLTCLAISSDSTLAVTGCEDGSIHVVNIVTGKVWCAFVTFNTTGRVSLVSCLVPWLVSHLKLSGF